MNPIFHWNTSLNLPLAFGLGICLLAFIVRQFSLNLLGHFWKHVITNDKEQEWKKMVRVVDGFIFVMLIHAFLLYFFSDFVKQYLMTWFKIVYILLFAWIIIKVAHYSQYILVNQQNKIALNRTLSKMLYRLLKTAIAVVAFIMIASELGYDMNGLLAGVSIGGLAIALAAQDVLGNIFGSIVIAFDKPFVLGDWIETSTYEGIVEEITFRSVRIRTFENALVSIPNSKIVNDAIFNWSEMKQRRLKFFVFIKYDANQDKLQHCLNKIRNYLHEKEEVLPSRLRIYVAGLETKGIKIQIECFLSISNYDAFLAFQEIVQMKILEIVQEEQLEMSYISAIFEK